MLHVARLRGRKGRRPGAVGHMSATGGGITQRAGGGGELICTVTCDSPGHPLQGVRLVLKAFLNNPGGEGVVNNSCLEIE